MAGRPPFTTSTRIDTKARGRSSTPKAAGASPAARATTASMSRHAPRPRQDGAVAGPGGYAEQFNRSSSSCPHGALARRSAVQPPPREVARGMAELRGMLHEIVDVTRGIAERISTSEPLAAPVGASHVSNRRTGRLPHREGSSVTIDVSPTQSHHPSQPPHFDSGGSGGRLNAEEVERVVRRVESHFAAKISESQEVIDQQAALIRQLRQRVASDKQLYEERIDALEQRIASNVDIDALLQQSPPGTPGAERGGGGSGGGVAAAVAVEQLKQLLHFEKRQRLQCEEQAQLLAEQHNRVVNTLEQRLKRLERQIHEGTGAASNGSLSYRQTPRSARVGVTLPATTATPISGGVAALPSDTPAASPGSPVRRHQDVGGGGSSASVPPIRGLTATTSGERDSAWASANHHLQRGRQEADEREPPQPSSDAVRAAEDVASFLDTITRELDSITAVESERNAAIERLI